MLVVVVEVVEVVIVEVFVRSFIFYRLKVVYLINYTICSK